MAQVLENTSVINEDHRSLSRCCDLKNPSTTKALTKAIAQAQSRSIQYYCSEDNNGGDGRFRIKFVVSKKELQQMVRSMGLERNGRRSDNHRPSAAGLEELLQALRKKHNKKAEFVSRRWQPELQSIPEEL